MEASLGRLGQLQINDVDKTGSIILDTIYGRDALETGIPRVDGVQVLSFVQREGRKDLEPRTTVCLDGTVKTGDIVYLHHVVSILESIFLGEVPITHIDPHTSRERLSELNLYARTALSQYEDRLAGRQG